MSQTDLLRETGAIFSDCAAYRFLLWRTWDTAEPFVNFVMLNPSTADAERNDPTVERCERFAKRWCYGGLYVTNLYALRATDPRELYQHPHPVCPLVEGRHPHDETDRHIVEAAMGSGLIVVAWGNHGGDRGQIVTKMLTDRGHLPRCLGVNKTGHPVHPLYQRNDVALLPFAGYAP